MNWHMRKKEKVGSSTPIICWDGRNIFRRDANQAFSWILKFGMLFRYPNRCQISIFNIKYRGKVSLEILIWELLTHRGI